MYEKTALPAKGLLKIRLNDYKFKRRCAPVSTPIFAA